MKAITINADDLGGGAKAVLEGLLGQREVPFKPASLAHIQDLLKGTGVKFEIGDKVKLRPQFSNNFRFPKADDVCIVTQVLDTPYRNGDSGTAIAGRNNDFAIAFIADDGDLVEVLYDSRMFEKVGSIYDPIELPNGEVVPTV